MTREQKESSNADDIRSKISDWSPVFEALSPSLRLRGEGVQRYGHCPFHDDRHPSFSMNARTGQWICFAGCGQGDGFTFVMKLHSVVFPEAARRLGELVGSKYRSRLSKAQLTLQQFASSKWLPVELLVENGWQEAGNTLRVVYRNEVGKASPRVRRRYALAARDGSSWEGPKDVPIIPYGLWRLKDARSAKQLVLVEGETDALTLWHHGFPALGLPGARMDHLLEKEHVKDIDTLYVVREPDVGGIHFAQGIGQRLRKLGWDGNPVEVAMEAGDINDLHRKGGPDTFRSSFLRLMNEGNELTAVNSYPRICPAEPFPVDALPEPLREFVESSAKAIVCSPDFIAVSLLVSCAAAIGNTCRIEVKRGWHEQLRFFAAIVAEPGSRKSPALHAATRPVLKEQVRLKNIFQEELAKYEEEQAVYEDAKKQRDYDGAVAPPEMPQLKQVYVSDTTIEALTDVLRENARGVLVVRDELAGWIRDQGRYQQGRSGERKQWLSLWSGSALVVNRRSLAIPTVIEDPLVNVIGNIHPDGLVELRGDAGYSDGLTERFLFAFPDPVPVYWSEEEIEERLENTLDEHFTKLWALQSHVKSGDINSTTFRMLPAARELFRTILSQHYEEMNGSQLTDILRGSWSKLEAYFARLTLLIHVCRYVECDTSLDVDTESVLRASMLLDYFKAHVRRVLQFIYGTDEDKRVDKAVRWIRRQSDNEIPVRDFLNSKVAGVLSMDEAHSLVSELSDRGVGHITTKKGGERGPGKLIFVVTSPPES